MIAGFETPDEGDIYLGDTAINALAPNERDSAMVFQSYALFPHYNVYENVAYGLKMRKRVDAEGKYTSLSKDEIKAKVSAMLDLVQLGGMEERMIFIRYESPKGEMRHRHLFNGGNGEGTVCLYRFENGKRILIDEIEAKNVGCEYGEYAED